MRCTTAEYQKCLPILPSQAQLGPILKFMQDAYCENVFAKALIV